MFTDTEIVAFWSLTVPVNIGVGSFVVSEFTVIVGSAVSYVTELSLDVGVVFPLPAASLAASAAKVAVTVPSELIPVTETV